MKYYIAKFKRYIPSIEGMKIIVSLSGYTLIEITEEALPEFPFSEVPNEEITEIEATEAWKFYGEVRPYRKAYSDPEGLEPDEDELAKGKRKTKVYFTEEITNATILLMKRIMKRQVIDEFDTRENRDAEQEILANIDSATDIKQLNILKENLLGIEMPKTLAVELGLWNEETNSRIEKVNYNLGF